MALIAIPPELLFALPTGGVDVDLGRRSRRRLGRRRGGGVARATRWRGGGASTQALNVQRQRGDRDRKLKEFGLASESRLVYLEAQWSAGSPVELTGEGHDLFSTDRTRPECGRRLRVPSQFLHCYLQ